MRSVSTIPAKGIDERIVKLSPARDLKQSVRLLLLMSLVLPIYFSVPFGSLRGALNLGCQDRSDSDGRLLRIFTGLDRTLYDTVAREANSASLRLARAIKTLAFRYSLGFG